MKQLAFGEGTYAAFIDARTKALREADTRYLVVNVKDVGDGTFRFGIQGTSSLKQALKPEILATYTEIISVKTGHTLNRRILATTCVRSMPPKKRAELIDSLLIVYLSGRFNVSAP